MRKLFIMPCIIAVISVCSFDARGENKEAFSPDEKYCAGLFSPETNDDFVKLSSRGIDTAGKTLYLRAAAADALALMIADFRKEHPKIRIWVQSATRNFSVQKSIWDRKWKSEMFAKYRDPERRARAILAYSSMPGTSRHHWGTDFDINELVNSYYESGDGKVIFSWLEKNAKKYGFARPFTAGRKRGYQEEKWHWSFIPAAHACYRGWLSYYGKDLSFFTKKGVFEGSEVAGR
ncbi:MAG TPA: M15 family metallopeptidase, partial [Spirochaetota bacterium]|nr:M15 family metallopeptidase [Spirochaetota bacterium]